jgi:hypothetical protein
LDLNCRLEYEFVILSEAKDLLSLALTRKLALRFAQDDKLDLRPRRKWMHDNHGQATSFNRDGQ